MARMARVVVPDIPHHITQRGNRRQSVFFSDADKAEYIHFLKEEATKNKVLIWAWCLMDNHVHFVAVPSTEESLAKVFGDTHKRYTRRINFREKWRGYLWQGRFSSFPMDEPYLLSAVRYVERNPVEAGIVSRAEDYSWSSAKAHVHGTSDPLLSPSFLDERIQDWSAYLCISDENQTKRLIRHSKTGRPMGDDRFLRKLEQFTGRVLQKAKPGPRSHVGIK
ncbi:MAG: transposase [Omnitrophica bacterium RIFOXYB12_FULL_50_7]|nr:MAG: transposase [Omnitrophica bacterium RIFOXYB12_FULL_50_7]